MNELVAQIIGPNVPLWARVLALITLGAVAIFVWMATNSVRRSNKD